MVTGKLEGVRVVFATAFWINRNCADCSYPSQKKSIDQDARWWEGLLGLATVNDSVDQLRRGWKFIKFSTHWVMISKLSDIFLGKRPFLVILSVRLKNTPYAGHAAQSPFAPLSQPLGCYWALPASGWVLTYFFVNHRSCLSLGTFSNAPACLLCKTIGSTYHISYQHVSYILASNSDAPGLWGIQTCFLQF